MVETKLTKTEQLILDGIIEYEKRYNRKPSYSEIGFMVSKSKTTISKVVHTLILKGRVKKTAGVSKSIEIIKR